MTTWTIAQLERNTADGGVLTAHWRVTAEDGDYTASAYGTCGFSPDASATDYIHYDQLTESDVLEWVYAAVDKDAVEASLTAQIDEQKNPTTEAGVPW